MCAGIGDAYLPWSLYRHHCDMTRLAGQVSTQPTFTGQHTSPLTSIVWHYAPANCACSRLRSHCIQSMSVLRLSPSVFVTTQSSESPFLFVPLFVYASFSGFRWSFRFSLVTLDLFCLQSNLPMLMLHTGCWACWFAWLALVQCTALNAHCTPPIASLAHHLWLLTMSIRRIPCMSIPQCINKQWMCVWVRGTPGTDKQNACTSSTVNVSLLALLNANAVPSPQSVELNLCDTPDPRDAVHTLTLSHTHST